MLDDIIRYGLTEIFAMFEFDSIAAYTIKLTRDAEFDIEYDVTRSLFEKISKSVVLYQTVNHSSMFTNNNFFCFETEIQI